MKVVKNIYLCKKANWEKKRQCLKLTSGLSKNIYTEQIQSERKKERTNIFSKIVLFVGKEEKKIFKCITIEIMRKKWVTF